MPGRDHAGTEVSNARRTLPRVEPARIIQGIDR